MSLVVETIAPQRDLRFLTIGNLWLVVAICGQKMWRKVCVCGVQTLPGGQAPLGLSNTLWVDALSLPTGSVPPPFLPRF